MLVDTAVSESALESIEAQLSAPPRSKVGSVGAPNLAGQMRAT